MRLSSRVYEQYKNYSDFLLRNLGPLHYGIAIYIHTGKTIGDDIWIVNHTMVSVTKKNLKNTPWYIYTVSTKTTYSKAKK